MGAFTHGLMHGFINSTFGWGMPFGFGCCCPRPFMPMFLTPMMNFNNFFVYSTPQVSVPSLPMPELPSWKDFKPSSQNESVWNYQLYQNPYPQFSFPEIKFEFTNQDVFKKEQNSNSYELANGTFSTKPAATLPSANTKTNNTNNTKTNHTQNLKSKTWAQMTDTEMLQVYGKYTRDITTPYTGTAADLNKYLKGKGVLEGKGQAFIDAQNKYGVSAAVLVGICMNESGGTSELAKNKNNVGGVRVAGSTEFRSYNSVEECIDHMARFLKNGYIDNNGRPLTKLYQVNAKYCPTADPTDTSGHNGYWASTVERYTKEVEKVRA